ncbi:GAF domain-containing protein [Tolypothrix sp. FACHB-123]|uniref:methyl-accepting chemotaxis protein n=1 Tax=Tolypothrix sp. FACHB-123 TaxID=2692868 RepID=UPI0016871C30|nr:GAF domain-containing protein [Tolypothrix sp. FACHB-123]MBD2356206.1 GAF domain-containing protein [Tolypothrix sp. FACHB-123]
MTKSSPEKQVGDKRINQLQGSQQHLEKSRLESSKLPTIIQISHLQQLGKHNWSLKTKAIVWSCAISMLPMLAVGTATFYIGNQLITEQIPDNQQLSTQDLTVSKQELQTQLSLLLLTTGVTSLAVGAIAAFLANRAIRPLLNAAALSNNIVQRLLPEHVNNRRVETSNNELLTLEKNISLIKKQLPDLLWKQEAEAEQVQILMNITHRIQESLTEEDVLKTTVEEVRTALRCDRVTIFHLNADGEGTFIAESVTFGLPKALWATVKDPCFAREHCEKYRDGYILAIDDIYQAELTECHISLLERFAVKANLVAPILKKGQLFGLLIAHECSKPRFWQQYEIDLFAQISSQVGFALNYTQLLEQVDTKANQTQVFVDITRRIRKSLNEEDVLKTTVEEVRKAIGADRVVIYGFDPEWYGTVIAESVLPGFPKALWAKIKDPCFAEGYVEKYQAGRVQAISNIYADGLTDCHISQLAPFAVKANLVAPILKDDQLLGLLIAHQCSSSRDWQQHEIDLFTQVAMQVGFALDHARLLNQVDRAYQTAEGNSMQQRQKQEQIQLQISQLLKLSNAVVETLSTELVPQQMQSVSSICNQLEILGDSATELIVSAQQMELQQQQLSQWVEDENQSIGQILESICTIQKTVVAAAEKVNRIEQPAQKLAEIVTLMSNVVSQMKLQTMQTALEASRAGEAGQQFAAIAQKVLSLIQQLDSDIASVQPLVAEIQTESHEMIVAIESHAEQAKNDTTLVETTQQQLNRAIAIAQQIKTLVAEITRVAALQSQTSTSAKNSILEVSNITNQTSEQTLAMADSLSNLAIFTQEI